MIILYARASPTDAKRITCETKKSKRTGNETRKATRKTSHFMFRFTAVGMRRYHTEIK